MRSRPRARSLRGLLRAALLPLLWLLACGCEVIWPQNNPLDPARCEPRCPSSQLCLEGKCVFPDAGSWDLGPRPDAGDPGLDGRDLRPDAGQQDATRGDLGGDLGPDRGGG